MAVSQLTMSRHSAPFRASKAPVQRRLSIVCASTSAKAAPLPSLLKAIGTEEINSKSLWGKLAAEPTEFKSRSYMKDVIDHAKRKNWVSVKFDGTMFVYQLTEFGLKKLEVADA